MNARQEFLIGNFAEDIRGAKVLYHERTDLHLIAAPQYQGQTIAIKGVPSFPVMEMIAEALDYDIEWSIWIV